jgi:hypothetical protein
MIGIPIERARSADELLGIVAEEVTHGPTKVLAHGFDESRWEDRRVPTLTQMDELFGMPVILIRADGHLSLVNSALLAESGALELDGVDRDPDGRPTGVVRRDANRAVQRWFHEALNDHRRKPAAAALAAAPRGYLVGLPSGLSPEARGRLFDTVRSFRPRSSCTSPRTTSVGARPGPRDHHRRLLAGRLDRRAHRGDLEQYVDNDGTGVLYGTTTRWRSSSQRAPGRPADRRTRHRRCRDRAGD